VQRPAENWQGGVVLTISDVFRSEYLKGIEVSWKQLNCSLEVNYGELAVAVFQIIDAPFELRFGGIRHLLDKDQTGGRRAILRGFQLENEIEGDGFISPA